MDTLIKDDYEFLIYPLEKGISVGFSTAKGGLNFNKNTSEGLSNLNKLREWFSVKEVIYLSQVHGADVYDYKCGDNLVNKEGDGLVTSEKNTIIGVFTADCVPIILVDRVKGVMAALHSGWRGTINNITNEGIKKMIYNYGSKVEDIQAFIGPHNKSCCYEVSEELIDTFKENKLFKEEDINIGRNLNLQKCVELELIKAGVKKENIIAINLCTYCNEEKKLYSYRKQDESEGRLFSFVFANEED